MPFAWATQRFEMGLERKDPLHALSDYLLALRSLLEGSGPVGVEWPLRVAALCAEPADRDTVRVCCERGAALERETMLVERSGSNGAADDPAAVVARIEGYLRAILSDAASGYLGDDLRATADEILLADGLAMGVQRLADTDDFPAPVDPVTEEIVAEVEEPEPIAVEPVRDARMDWEPLTEEIVVTRVAPEPEPEPVVEQPTQEWSVEALWTEERAAAAPWVEKPAPDRDGLLDAVPPWVNVTDWAGSREALETNVVEFEPRPSSPRNTRDELPPDTEEWAEVHQLFPDPGATEWLVDELDYDRRAGLHPLVADTSRAI